MAMQARSVRSNAVPSDGRPSAGETRPALSTPEPRPQLHLVVGGRARSEEPSGIARLVTWTRARRLPVVHIVIAALFLVSSLLGALMLRTQMVQNSFEASTVQESIGRLTQDVEEDQSKLDALMMSLPDKAQKMGMVPQSGSISIDLNGYTPTYDKPKTQPTR
ncbi:hypothetical protein [Bifidobacterium jacchi]